MNHLENPVSVNKLLNVILISALTALFFGVNVEPAFAQEDQLLRNRQKTEMTGGAREFTFNKKYLLFPVKFETPEYLIHVRIDNELVREFSVNLVSGEPDYWVYLEIDEFKGKKATVLINRLPSKTRKAFDSIYQSDTFPGQDKLYKEKLRAQFHFSAKRGWSNDSNGLTYYDGEYHLFYQHNPYACAWGNLTWGHAVSTDLVHWEELGSALHPDELGTIFSGGGVVDHKNTSGFQTGVEKPIVCFYTNAGGDNPWSKGKPFTQSMAYSNDRGRTFTKYQGNPIIDEIKGGNRDPKVIWHEPTGKWVMVLYVEDRQMDFFTSDDLKTWTKTSRLKSFHECPELFELPVDGNENHKKWVFHGGSGDYFIGDFDGSKFTPESEPIKYSYGNAFYASQTFSNIPEEDGRRIRIGWATIDYVPGMPFNQIMNFPVVLTLGKTDEGIRMFTNPVREIEKLHKKKHSISDEVLKPGKNPLSKIKGDLFDIRAEFAVEKAAEIGFEIRGVPVVYNAEKKVLSCQGHEAPCKPMNGKIKLQILVDRTLVEIFINDGESFMPIGVTPDNDNKSLKVFSKGGSAHIEELTVYEMKSIWPQ